MAQAQTYKRKKNFAENNPDQTDLAAIDNELDAVALSVNGVIQNVALIQKDDGTLANGIVGPANVTEEFLESIKGEPGEQGPQGERGEKGDDGTEGPRGPTGGSFAADAMGLLAEKAQYDAAAKNFSFLATDAGKLYIKLSDAENDWSAGYSFGTGPQGPEGPRGLQGARGYKGDKGDKGDTGEKGDKGDTGAAGANGKDGLITSVNTAQASVNIVGKRNLQFRLRVVSGVLSIDVSATA